MIIAVDPGRTTGVAVFAGEGPAFAKVDRPTVAYAHALLSWGKAKAAALGRLLKLVVEDQYAEFHTVTRGRKVIQTINVPALKSLVRAAELWIVVADLLGIPWTRVMPAKWQGPSLKGAPPLVKKSGFGQTKFTTKHQAQWVVRHTWDDVVRFWTVPEAPAKVVRVQSSKVPIDPCDALLIGRWFDLHGMAHAAAR